MNIEIKHLKVGDKVADPDHLSIVFEILYYGMHGVLVKEVGKTFTDTWEYWHIVTLIEEGP